jgi:protease I
MKNVAILLDDLVEDVEFIYPYYRFLEENWNVDVLALRLGEFKGKKGGVFVSNKILKEEDFSKYDILYIPGGYAPDRLRRYEIVLNFVRYMYENGKIVSAICHAPWVLISAKIVKNKKITGFFAIKDDIINAGAIYTGNPVEIDGNIITGTDPKAMPHMVKKVIEVAKGK